MLIQAAINGDRIRAAHPAIPITPQELAAAAAECVAAGADAIHFHVRASDAKESLAAGDVTRAVAAMRGAVQVPFGVSTGAWIVPDPQERLAVVGTWTLLPDFASVNFHEEGAAALAELFLSRGVAVEVGLCDASAAQRFVASGLARRGLRVLLEPQEQDVSAALRTATEIGAVLDTARIRLPRILHGTELTVWPIFDDALSRGHDVRIGLEDTLLLPDGHLARNNAELVAEAARRAQLQRPR